MNYNEDPFNNSPSNNPEAQGSLKLQIKEQDFHLDHLHGTLQEVRKQTDAINLELREHNELLGKLGDRMDETETSFEGASRRVRVLYGELTDRKFTWTATALIIILTFLLLILLCT